MAETKIDKRKFNRGHPGSGRKPKAEEELLKRFTTEAMVEVFGSMEGFFIHLATEAKESFPHLRLLMEYRFGRPKETKDITLEGVEVTIKRPEDWN